jgi:two-component system cell cycle response regulator
VPALKWILGEVMKFDITILYVEDDETIRTNTQRPLQRLCQELYVAKDGVEGIKLFKEHQPDIIVSDIKMPNMNGIDMIKAIKAIAPEQKIIFTTAHNESGFFLESIELQVDGYILKPIDYEFLTKKVQKLATQTLAERELHDKQILLDEIANLQNGIVLTFGSEGKLIFTNRYFLSFFQVSNIEEFRQNFSTLGEYFIQSDEYFTPNPNSDLSCIEQIKSVDESKRIVSMVNLKTRYPQAFYVSIRTIKETAHTIITFTEITDLAIEKNQLKHQSTVDALTNIYNRAFFNEAIHNEIEEAKRYARELSIISFDIDHFKQVNDNHGHDNGDIILKELAALVKDSIRQADVFARVGGEEFMIIAPSTSGEGATALAEQIRVKIETHHFSNGLKTTSSFGVTQYQSDEAESTLLKRVDIALYEAKSSGRNRVVTHP